MIADTPSPMLQFLLEEHRLLLGLQKQQRALGAEQGLAVAAEPVAIDRGVLYTNLLAAGNRVFRIIARGGELENAVDMVLHIAVGREQRAGP